MSLKLFKKFCLITMMTAALQSCGGRAAQPILQFNALDDVFSCEHLKAEFNVNKQKIAALNDEKEQRSLDNTTQLIFGSPLLLDLTSTLEKERAALQSRNAQVTKLGILKSCVPFEPEPADKA